MFIKYYQFKNYKHCMSILKFTHKKEVYNMQNNNLKQSITLEDVFTLFVNKQEDFKSMELKALLQLYVKMQSTKVRPDTIDMYLDHMGDMVKFFSAHGVYETKDVNQDIIDKFVKYCKSRNNKNITINKRIGMLTAMFRRSADAGLITMPEYKYEKLKEAKAKIETIQQYDVMKILKHIDSMKLSHQVIIYILLSTGIRRNEVVNIKVHNIDFKNKSIYLEHTKSGKARYCYFGEKLEELLKRQIELAKNEKSGIYLLPGRKRDHLDKQSISAMLFSLKKTLNIDILSSHKFRHLYATQLLKNGADIFTVKELLGHEKLENTQRYLDFTNEEIKQNNFKYNPLNNFK